MTDTETSLLMLFQPFKEVFQALADLQQKTRNGKVFTFITFTHHLKKPVSKLIN